MPNHITNGVFETNTATGSSQSPDGWSTVTNSPDLQTDGGFEWAGSYMPGDLDASAGSGYITLYARSDYYEAMQTTLNTPVVSGETYTFTFDFYVNESNGSSNVAAATNIQLTIGSQVVTIPIDSTGASAPYWQSASVTFTATNTSSTLQIASTTDSGTLLYTGTALDNLSLDVVTPSPDYIVSGTGGDDLIDAGYLGDPEGDLVDNLDHSDGSNDDSIEAGAGDDTINAGAGDDTIYGGTGEDAVQDSAGDDSVFGGEGKDRFDYTTITGDDTVVGGEINDTSLTDSGDKLDAHNSVEDISVVFDGDESGTMTGTTGTVQFSEIEHIMGGQGEDTIDASASSVQQILDGGEGSDTLTGGSGDDIIAMGQTQDFSATDGDNDTLVLFDGFGNDSIEGFEVPTSLGGGAYAGNDQVDVSGLTDASGDPVDTDDVSVSDTNGDGSGDAILTFPNGESITLWGVSVSDVSSQEQLVAMGIPAASSLNYIVEGTTGDDIIDASYLSDPEGDRVDNNDHSDGSNDDLIQADLGDDSVVAGLGDDTVYGGFGDDTITGGSGNDSLFGNEDNDSITGGSGNDTIEGGLGNDTMIGGDGDDSINGAAGDDYIVGGAGDDFLRGSFGSDTITGGTGDDTLWGGFGDDTFNIDAGFGDYLVEGESEDETVGDTMDVSAVTDDLTWDLTAADPESGTFSNGVNTGTFTDIENIILGSGTDTLVLGTFGGSDSVNGFAAPTDTGGGTYSGNDQLDVSGLVDDDGNPTHTGNVTVTDTVGDGSGDAILTFPNGETLTLVGVLAADVSSPAQLIAMGIPEGPDGYVDGTSGADVIDIGYTGDPNFDMIDNGDAILPGAAPNDDYVRAGGGDDSVQTFAGDDTVELGTGDDTAEGGTGDDTLDGGAGDDSLVGGFGADSLVGGAGDDTLRGQVGDDVMEGGAGSDTFTMEEDFGDDTVIGGEVDDAAGDTLDMSGIGGAFTYDLTGVDAEAGTVTDGTSTLTFSEIETIQLSGGQDTLVLTNGSGADVVTGFTAPVLDGGGSYIGFDKVDVSTMLDANGAMVNTGDVTITDTNGDGTGDTILTFPDGDSLTLIGVPPSAFPTPEALAAIGIPLADYIVEGTAAGELIDGSYLGDPEGDLVDANDAADASNDDSIEAGAGDDTVLAGAGDDIVFGDTGNDSIDAGTGDDSVFAGDDDDTVLGGAGADSLFGQSGDDSLSGGGDNDDIDGGTGSDTLAGDAGDDTLDGGSGDDLLEGGVGADSLLGDFGNDTLAGGAGADVMIGGFGDDTFLLSDGFGDDTIDGEADAETVGDTLNVSGVTTEGVSILFDGDESGTVTGAVSGDVAEFADIENITATGNSDTINAALDTLGVNIDAGAGDDIVTGGSASDTLLGGDGDDVLAGGAAGDEIVAGAGDDTIQVAQGDTVTGGDGDDFFNLVDLGETDTDTITIVGGEGDETDGDTLALNGLHDRDSLVITDPDDVNGGLSGSVTLLDGTVVNFTNIENIICFAQGTNIATPYGRRAIEELKVGDSVITQDNGIQKVSWIGKSKVPGFGKLAPVRIDKSVFPGAEDDLIVSPQHRMLFKGYQAELLFGENEVLAPAIHLVDGHSIEQLQQETITYVHIMFERHEIIFANGVATESFHPGNFGVDALAPQCRDELFAIFPQLRSDLSSYGQSARLSLREHDSRLLAFEMLR